MPNEKIEPETDGNPKTKLEDTKAHERTGFLYGDVSIHTPDEFKKPEKSDENS